MEIPKINKCGNCAYAKKHLTELRKLICRRYPPSIVGGFVQTQGGLTPLASYQLPVVEEDDYCGEYLDEMLM